MLETDEAVRNNVRLYLARSMMLEPTPKGRIAAIGVLSELLDGSKQFLASKPQIITSRGLGFSKWLAHSQFEVCLAPQRCWMQNTSQIQNKE